MQSLFDKLLNVKRQTVFLYNDPTKGDEEELLNIDATISENLSSNLEVTEHPVEEGPNISDNVVSKPKELTIEGIVSESPLTLKAALAGNAAGATSLIGGIGGTIATGVTASLAGKLLNKSQKKAQDYLNVLLGIQEGKMLLTVITGLKVYNNMVLTNLTVPRDVTTGKMFKFIATLKEMIIVHSETIKLDASKTSNEGAVSKVNEGRKSAKSVTSQVQERGKSALVGFGVPGL